MEFIKCSLVSTSDLLVLQPILNLYLHHHQLNLLCLFRTGEVQDYSALDHHARLTMVLNCTYFMSNSSMTFMINGCDNILFHAVCYEYNTKYYVFIICLDYLRRPEAWKQVLVSILSPHLSYRGGMRAWADMFLEESDREPY